MSLGNPDLKLYLSLILRSHIFPYYKEYNHVKQQKYNKDYNKYIYIYIYMYTCCEVC